MSFLVSSEHYMRKRCEDAILGWERKRRFKSYTDCDWITYVLVVETFGLQSYWLFICFQDQIALYLLFWEPGLKLASWSWQLELMLLVSWQFPSSSTACERHGGNEKQTHEDNQTTRQYKERKPGNYSGALAPSFCHITRENYRGVKFTSFTFISVFRYPF